MNRFVRRAAARRWNDVSSYSCLGMRTSRVLLKRSCRARGKPDELVCLPYRRAPVQ